MAEGFFFPGSSPADTDAMLALRQRIAMNMLGHSARRGYPRNLGEGLTAIGDSLGEMGMMRQLASAQTAIDAKAAQRASTEAAHPAPGETPPPQGEPQAALPLPANVANANASADMPEPQQTAEAEAPPSPIGASAYGPSPTDISSASYGSSIVPAVPQAPRNAIATAMLQPPTAPGVPQANPTQSGGDATSPPQEVLSDASPAPLGSPSSGIQQAPVQMAGDVRIKRPDEPADPYVTPPQIQSRPELRAPTLPPMGTEQLRLMRLKDDPTILDPAAKAMYQRKFDLWEQDRQAKFAKEKTDYERIINQPKLEAEQQAREIELRDKLENDKVKAAIGGVDPAKFEAMLAKSKEKGIDNIPTTLAAIRKARELAASGAMYTGLTADADTYFSKLLSAAGFPVDPKVSGTEQFRTTIGNIMALNRNAVVGTGSQSEPELRLLTQVSAATPTLEPGSIVKAMDAAESLALKTALAHQAQVRRFAGTDNPDRITNVYAMQGVPQMVDVVPQRSVDKLVARYRNDGSPESKAANEALFRDLDNTYHTPGLAEQLLRYRAPQRR